MALEYVTVCTRIHGDPNKNKSTTRTHIQLWNQMDIMHRRNRPGVDTIFFSYFSLDRSMYFSTLTNFQWVFFISFPSRIYYCRVKKKHLFDEHIHRSVLRVMCTVFESNPLSRWSVALLTRIENHLSETIYFGSLLLRRCDFHGNLFHFVSLLNIN